MSRGIVAAVWAFVVVVSLWSIWAYNWDEFRLDDLTHEDGVFEYGQAILYAAGGVAFLVGWVRSRFRNIWALGLGIVLILVAGEEISWGQRIFDVDTPASLRGVNVQGETNLHNLEGVNQSVRAASTLFIVGVLIVVPLLNHYWGWARERCSRWSVPVAPLWTLPVTVAAMLFMIIPRLLFDDVVFALDEVGELFTALVFAVFGAVWTWSIWNARRDAARQRRSEGDDADQSTSVNA